MDKEAAIMKVLSEPIRLRLAVLLAMEGEVCVCRLAAAMGEPEDKVSRHLGLMRSAGLGQARRGGTWMYYQLARPKGAFQLHVITLLKTDFDGHPAVKADRKRLKQADCK